METKLYYDDSSKRELLELSDTRIFWSVNNENFDFDSYEFFVNSAISQFESKYKNLKIFLCGRSDRHVCVENTAQNRRRYVSLVNYCDKLQKMLINRLNEKTVELTKEQENEFNSLINQTICIMKLYADAKKLNDAQKNEVFRIERELSQFGSASKTWVKILKAIID